MRNSFKECFSEKIGIKLPKTFVPEVVKEEDVMKQQQKEWWIRAYQKLIENCLSIKVWVLAGNAVVSAFLVYKFSTPDTVAQMFGDWCAFNGGVVTAIIGMREAFKVAKVKNGNNGNSKNVMV